MLFAGAPSAWANNDTDVRLIIDISGSMKRNDPQNLREPAVSLLMELLPEDGRAGVWTFGKEVNMLVPLGQVDDAWRKMATEKASQINSVGLYTNIGSVLEKATAISKQSSGNAHLILLTDGMVDIDKNPEVNAKEWRRIVDDVLPQVKKAGFTIHTVALSDNADTHLMKTLSQATDGYASVAKKAEDLMPAFLKAFDAAAPAQQVPLAGNHFVVDSSVEEFTALMFRDTGSSALSLTGPDQLEIKAANGGSDVKWHSADNYDLVTIKRPLEGEWRVNGDLAEGSRITVVSDLNLRVKPLPINAELGSELELQLALQENKSVVTRKDFLKLLTITANVSKKRRDGSIGNVVWEHTFNTAEPPKKGVFSTLISGFEKSGNYLIHVSLDGKSFQRKFSHELFIRAPFDADLEKSLNDNSQTQYLLTVSKNSQTISIKNTQIAVAIYTPDRRKQVQPLAINSMDTWQYAYLPTQEGKHRMEVKITGVDNEGNGFEFLLDDLNFNYIPGADFDSLFNEPSEEALDDDGAIEQENKEEEPKTAKNEEIESADKGSSQKNSSQKDSAKEENADEEGTDNADAAEEASTPWLIYAGLGIANLLLIVGGYIAFRKIMGPSKDPAGEEESDDAPPEPEPFEPSDESASTEEDDAEVMAMEEIEDDIPPMEDLAPDLDFEEDEPAEPQPTTSTNEKAASESEPPEPANNPAEAQTEERIDENFEFDLSALDGDTTTDSPTPNAEQQNAEEPAPEPPPATDNTPPTEEPPNPPEEEEDMQQAMLKAQGLDLAEDELDDAISNLIDELDDEVDDAEEKGAEGEINLDDFDFGEDDEGLK